ncbi:deoxyribonuclease HsdR [Sphingobacteriaceae bacterium]|nr:deoxyribonuclease HsdR [Sphingobacteriaceae bacterium]
MKKIVSSIFVACFGGFVALTGSHFLFENEHSTSQVTNPEQSNVYKLTNYSSSASGGMSDFTMAAEKSVNSVVHIKTISEQVNNLSYDPFAELFFGQPKKQQSYIQQGSGSGVIISQDGYIVTNNHVIAGSDKIEVILNDRRTYEAEVIGADASTDVALLKIKEKNLPFLNYGNSDVVKVGEWVLAVGNPFNLNSTVTAGIVSAKGRNNILNGNKRPIESFIQTDAAVNPGNSGGALVNTEGELIGINTAIASNNGSYQGYSFAVPVNIVKKVVSDMVEFGTVQRAYIGVSIQDIDAKFAAEKNLKQLTGVYVNGLTLGGSAEDAGVLEGDVIKSIQDVSINSVSELQEQISRYRPGDKINVAISRNNKNIVIPVVLKTLDNTTNLVKKSEMVKSTASILGAELEDIDGDELTDMKIENGVRIQKLNSGRLAQTGIQAGFIITHIDKQKMESSSQVKKRLEKSGPVLIEGFYTNGMRASYSFGL